MNIEDNVRINAKAQSCAIFRENYLKSCEAHGGELAEIAGRIRTEFLNQVEQPCPIISLEYDTQVSFNEAMNEKELLEKRGLDGWTLCAVLQCADCMTKHYFVRAKRQASLAP